jgi:hypothetical protein
MRIKTQAVFEVLTPVVIKSYSLENEAVWSVDISVEPAASIFRIEE